MMRMAASDTVAAVAPHYSTARVLADGADRQTKKKGPVGPQRQAA